MPTVFAPRLPSVAPIHGLAAGFPIGRIYCVGRNYAAHAREMGQDPDREPPFFFLKDADAYIGDGAVVTYPPETTNYHHEIELVVAIGKAGFRIAPAEALSHVYGYAVGLDMTRRDLQARAREQGKPWCTAKNVPESAPMGAIHRIEDTGEITAGAISLTVNGAVRQSSDIGQMIWSVNETIGHLSRYYRLLPGDLIFTGTPENVAAVVPGDRLLGAIAGLGQLSITIGERAGYSPHG